MLAQTNLRPNAPVTTTPGDSNASGNPAASASVDLTSFKPSEIGYFYPNMPWDWGDADSVERDGKVYYRNVYAFTNRVRVAAQTQPKLKSSLDACLCGEAEQWWTNQLTEVMRMGYIAIHGVEHFCRAIEIHFHPTLDEFCARFNATIPILASVAISQGRSAQPIHPTALPERVAMPLPAAPKEILLVAASKHVSKTPDFEATRSRTISAYEQPPISRLRLSPLSSIVDTTPRPVDPSLCRTTLHKCISLRETALRKHTCDPEAISQKRKPRDTSYETEPGFSYFEGILQIEYSLQSRKRPKPSHKSAALQKAARKKKSRGRHTSLWHPLFPLTSF